MSHIALTVTATILLAGFSLTPPAALSAPATDPKPITKWFPGEQKPDVSSSTLPPLGLFPTTPSVGLRPSAPTSAPVAAAVAATVSVRSHLDPDKRRFHLDEPIHLFVELSWVGEAGDVVPDAPEEPPLMNLSKKAMIQSARVVPQSGRETVVVTYHYVLEPTAEGAGAIEPIRIRYRLRGGGSEPLQLTSDRYALTILPRRWPWGKILLGGVAVVAVAGAIAGVTVALVARARRKREAAKVAPPPSPFDLMRADLDQIRRLFTEGVARGAYDRVERFVRKALGQRLGGELRFATISELSERLANEPLDSAIRDRAISILDRCAQVKFAGYVPTVADQDQIVADCRLFLDDLEKQG